MTFGFKLTLRSSRGKTAAPDLGEVAISSVSSVNRYPKFFTQKKDLHQASKIRLAELWFPASWLVGLTSERLKGQPKPGNPKAKT